MQNNNRFPDKYIVESRKLCYPPGTRVELVSMNDPFSELKPGDRGSVIKVDDIGTCHIAWDCGSYLGAVIEDKIRKVVDS